MGFIQLKLAKRMKKKAENSKRNREAQANHEEWLQSKGLDTYTLKQKTKNFKGYDIPNYKPDPNHPKPSDRIPVGTGKKEEMRYSGERKLLGIDKSFNDIYIETSTLGSYGFEKLKGKSVSLWTRVLSKSQKLMLRKLYYDCDLEFNNSDADIHIFALNYFNQNDLDVILGTLKGKKMLFYYQNQNYHQTNEQKDQELQNRVNKYTNVIGKHTGYSWWTYIRHFIIKN